MRGQVALEYMIIVAIVIAFILPVWAYVSTTQVQTGLELSSSYAKNAVKQIGEAADLVYSQGPPAKLKIQVHIPNNIDQITISNSTIVFRLRTTGGYSDIFERTSAEINGSLPTSSGTYQVTVEAVGDLVQIGLAE